MDRRVRYLSLLVVFGFCGCFGCAGSAIRPHNPQAFNAREELYRDSADRPPYRIQIGDGLAVKAFNNSELNEEALVRPDGKITLQLLGSVEAAGQTPEQLSADIQKKYTRFYKNPSISVSVKSCAGQRVYIGGEVRQPGLVRLDADTTLLQAVFQAGGYLNTADLTSTILIRRDDGRKPKVYELDLTDPVNDVGLHACDIVYIPRSQIASMNLFVEQYIDRLIPISRSIGFTYVTDLYIP